MNKQQSGRDVTNGGEEAALPTAICSTIFVVIEDDRGMGETLIAAYPIRQKADEHAKESGHYYVQECPFFSSNIVGR